MTVEYTTRAVVKARLGIPTANTDSDDLIDNAIAAAGSTITNYVGVEIGPSSDTTRLYDGRDATRNGTRLWIPGGIRTLTQVRLADETSGTLTTATLGDFLLRPKAFQRRADAPALYIDISENPAGSYAWFPPYQDNVELTGTFGYAAVPSIVADRAASLAVRMFQARASGERGAVNMGGEGFGDAFPFLTSADRAVLDTYKHETVSVAG